VGRESAADDLPTKQKRWFSLIVFLKDGIEGDILAVMSRLTVRNIEHGSVIDFFPFGLTREKYKRRLRVDKIPDNHGQATRSTLIFSRVIHFMPRRSLGTDGQANTPKKRDSGLCL
jgi:hypothetical protein